MADFEEGSKVLYCERKLLSLVNCPLFIMPLIGLLTTFSVSNFYSVLALQFAEGRCIF